MEVELKLALPAAAIARLARHPALRPLKRGRASRQRLVATYYDTPDHRLAQRQVALRVRKEGRQWVQAVKGPATAGSGGGLATRAEHEWPLGGGRVRPAPDLARLADTELGRDIARLTRKHPLVPLFTTTVIRTTVPLAFPDSTMALAAIDVGHVHATDGSRRRASIVELELELEAGDPARLFDLALALAADLPLKVERRSKAARGYALVAPRDAAPVRAEPIEYAADASAPHAFAAIVRNCLRQIEGNADGLLRDDDDEWIHQMRIGVRRLRSALTLARPLLPPASAGHVVDDLRWLAGALGPARDFDVFVAQTLPSMRSAARRALGGADALEAVVAPLAAKAATRRQEVRVDARDAVASRRFQRLLLAAGALAASSGHWGGPQAAQRSTTPATGIDFARRVLKRRHRKVQRAGEGITERTPGERHAFRIAAKKLRYATEFFAPFFPGRSVRSYRKALATLQDVLGRLNDGAVAAALAVELSDPGAPAAALFAGWSAADAQAHAAALDRAWARMRAAKPFWIE